MGLGKLEGCEIDSSIGLNPDEIKALFNLVIKHNIKYPLTCFTNARLLDDLIKKGLWDIEKRSKMTNEEKTFNSAILLEIKVKVERSLRENTGIRSTHFTSV